jgi:hypothetical protein
MIPEARACSYQLHTTRPYLTNRTYRENAEALGSSDSTWPRPVHYPHSELSSQRTLDTSRPPYMPHSTYHDQQQSAQLDRIRDLL